MLSWQVVGLTEGFPATAANWFHKELRFFFSLLKRKKEAKKEKNSRSTCTTRSNITRRLYREFSTYVKSFIFMWKPLHRLTAVPLVLSGPLCPAGISPPRGESPLSGEAFLTFEFSPTKIPRRGKQAAAAAVTLPFLQLKLGRKVSGDSPLSLLKRKKEAKKEKNSRSTCTVRFQYHPKIIQEILTNKTPPAGRTGGLSAVTLPLLQLKLGRRVSGDSPQRENIALEIAYKKTTPHKV